MFLIGFFLQEVGERDAKILTSKSMATNSTHFDKSTSPCALIHIAFFTSRTKSSNHWNLFL